MAVFTVEPASPVTWMANTLALCWFISYTCFLWVESVPTKLPCAWGIHGCAPHSLCKVERPLSFFSLPSCSQIALRKLPQNHPPVPGGAGGLCAAALESMSTARWQLWLPWTVAAMALCVGCCCATRRSGRSALYEPPHPPNIDAWLAEHARSPTGERARQQQRVCTVDQQAGASAGAKWDATLEGRHAGTRPEFPQALRGRPVTLPGKHASIHK